MAIQGLFVVDERIDEEIAGALVDLVGKELRRWRSKLIEGIVFGQGIKDLLQR